MKSTQRKFNEFAPMKLFFTLIVVLIIPSAIHAQLCLVDPLEAIYPDTNNLTNYTNNWACDYPKEAVVDVHVLIKLPKNKQFTISASYKDNKLGINSWSRLIDVPVEQNTGLDSRTEQYSGDINPHVIRKAPFRIFEVIQPVKSDAFISQAEYSAFRLTIPHSITKESGKHQVKIEVTSGKFKQEGNFNINIHPVSIPELSKSNFFYTNWLNLKKLEEQHNLKRWSAKWFAMLDKYAQLMAYGRQNCITIPAELFQYENEEIVLKDSLMLQFVDIFRKHGFKNFESPHLMYRGENDDWGDPELKVFLSKKRYYKENGKEDIDKIMKLIKSFVSKNKLTNQWLQHISDEPTSVNAKCYRDIAKQVKNIFPEVKIMEATNDKDSLVGAIDVWCPLINDFQENESFFREREKLGEDVLVYSCLIPGGKWLNRTLDMERLRQVYFGWGAARYNTSGYLHWGLNQYMADPFEQSVVKHPSPGAGATNFLPAGDTHIIYPGKDGPLSSIRFEAHRMGCEDYDLLQMLKNQNITLYNQLVNTLFSSYTEYNTNIKDYRKTRESLLKSLY